ncbi:restriction endonuclease subunit S (plasmid) [Campylobacterota bacterium DY0563]
MIKFRRETQFQKTEIGEIPREWEVKKVRDLGKIVTGKTPPTKRKEYWGNDYPFITPSDIPDYDVRYDYSVERYLSNLWAQKYPQMMIPKNTICFVCIGSTIGKLCLSKEDSFTNQQINNIIVKKDYNPIFVFYLMRLNQFRIKEEYGGGGAAKDIISKSKFEEIDIWVPPPPEQSRIATVLSWFDDLIENKKKQNEILEKTAMALFKSWFVDFEPFKDGEFVYSEELGREVPKGWEVRPIGEVADFTKGLSYKGTEKFYEKPKLKSFVFITLDNILRKGGFKTEYTWIISDRIKKRHYLQEEDLIMANTDMTQNAEVIGSPAIVIFPNDYKEKIGVYSHHITKIALKREYMKWYVYLFLKDTQNENTTFSTGTNVLGLDINNFKQNKFILLPPSPILQKFHKMVEPLFKKIIINEKEIMVLRKVRDALLPQLVFGKLRVVEI